MKKRFKIIIGLLLAMSIGILYLYIDEKSFSPLQEDDFKKLFVEYEDVKKNCVIDFLGVNGKGELFELYSYKTYGCTVNADYPLWGGEWENKQFYDEVLFENWRKCPMKSNSIDLFDFAISAANSTESTEICGISFQTELTNPNNFYSYVYFNELEQYLLIYSPNNKNLFYLRKRGF